MYATISTGGKQYNVAEGDTVAVERLDAKPGDTVGLSVLFIADGTNITVGEDATAKAKVFAEVIEHFRGEKSLSFKFKKRKGYKKIQGHRQELTRLLVKSISPTGEDPAKKKEEEKKAAEAKAAEAKAEEAKAAKKAAEKPAAEEKATKKPAAEKQAAEKPAAEKTAAAKKAELVEAPVEKTAAKRTTKKAEKDQKAE